MTAWISTAQFGGGDAGFDGRGVVGDVELDVPAWITPSVQRLLDRLSGALLRAGYGRR